MPEGDTLHRTAARLRPALVGRPLVRVEAHRATGSLPARGTEVTAVDAVGKHLVVRFADGHLLRTHLRMTGSWHLYRAGERWQKPAHLARAVVDVGDWAAVCFSAPVVVVERDPQASGGPSGDGAGDVDSSGTGAGLGRVPSSLGHLGPDLCLAEPDLDEAVRRMAAIPEPGTTIAEVLLDQRVAAGIGNVYKSEVLWALRVDPFASVEQVDEATRRALLERAHRLLRHNLTTTRRTTVAGPPGSLAVYGRRGQPCRACGTPIRTRTHGDQARTTSWCPRCQAPPP